MIDTGTQPDGAALRDRLVAPLFVVVALALYWPALSGGYIWDDYLYLAANPLVKASDGLYRIWFTTEAVDYWPMQATSFWLEWRLWGEASTGYHVTNVLLHVTNALLFGVALQKLSLPWPRVAALLFLVHPLNVLSVAWIAQRKNELSLLFFLLSTLAYIEGERRNAGGQRWPLRLYVASVAAFALAMLSKGSVAVLPAILLLIVWWMRGRVTRGDIARIVPFALLATGLTLLNIYMQTRHAATAIRATSLIDRIAGAGAVVWFYLWKAIAPIDLMFVYPQWNVDASRIVWWLPLAAVIGVTVLLVMKRRTALRAALFGWGFFVLALVPVLGLVDVYFMRYSPVADHYAYIALLAVTAGIAAAMFHVTRAGSPVRWAMADVSVPIAAGVLTCLLSLQTWRLAWNYVDELTLYAATLRANPQCWLCEANLAVPLIARGSPSDLNQALLHLQSAARLNPDGAEIHDGLGVVMQKLGRANDAVAAFERALELNPHSAATREHLAVGYEMLGRDLAEAGRLQDAAVVFQRSLEIGQGRAEVHRQLGHTLLELRQYDAALASFNEALRVDPGSAAAFNSRGAYWRTIGRMDQAVLDYRQAVNVAPTVGAWHNDLGSALLQQGEIDQSVQEFREAVRLDPSSATARLNLGVTLAQTNRFAEALPHLSEALRLDPGASDLAELISELRAKVQNLPPPPRKIK